MASTGVDVKNWKDVLPVPESVEEISKEQEGETSHTLAEPPTGELQQGS